MKNKILTVLAIAGFAMLSNIACATNLPDRACRTVRLTGGEHISFTYFRTNSSCAGTITDYTNLGKDSVTNVKIASGDAIEFDHNSKFFHVHKIYTITASQTQLNCLIKHTHLHCTAT